MIEPPIFLIARVLAYHDTLTDPAARALMKDVAERLSSALGDDPRERVEAG